MKAKDFEANLKRWNQEGLALTKRKGHDYSGEDDTLLNFKTIAKVLNAYKIRPPFTAAKVAMIYVLLKVQRLFNLLQNNKKPKNESIDDTAKDLTLYTQLLRACIMDEKEGK